MAFSRAAGMASFESSLSSNMGDEGGGFEMWKRLRV
jgi:hypothetical protein